MSDSLPNLRRKIKSAGDLQSVVRTMKALAAANLVPCERAVAALGDYHRTVEMGLLACFLQLRASGRAGHIHSHPRIGAIVFGTDQGMIGQFNERLAELVIETLSTRGARSAVWVVGERMLGRLADSQITVAGSFSAPSSVSAITSLVSDILLTVGQEIERTGLDVLCLFHNQPRQRASYDPVMTRVLPLDEEWRRKIEERSWPTAARPEIIAGGASTLDALIREYLFVSTFRACAECLAAENARRFAAMQGAEQNIGEILGGLTLTYNRRRQASIDEELFDLISGYEALQKRGL